MCSLLLLWWFPSDKRIADEAVVKTCLGNKQPSWYVLRPLPNTTTNPPAVKSDTLSEVQKKSTGDEKAHATIFIYHTIVFNRFR